MSVVTKVALVVVVAFLLVTGVFVVMAAGLHSSDSPGSRVENVAP